MYESQAVSPMMMQGADDRSAVRGDKRGTRARGSGFSSLSTAVSRGCHVAALRSRDRRLLRAAIKSMALVDVAVITSSVLYVLTWIFSSPLRADFTLCVASAT